MARKRQRPIIVAEIHVVPGDVTGCADIVWIDRDRLLRCRMKFVPLATEKMCGGVALPRHLAVPVRADRPIAGAERSAKRIGAQIPSPSVFIGVKDRKPAPSLGILGIALDCLLEAISCPQVVGSREILEIVVGA